MEYLKLYVLGASILYYSLFISTFIISWMIVPMVTSTGGTGQSRVNFLNEFVSILSQNIPFDFYLVSGGVTLSFGSLLFLVESLDSENAILVSILKSPSSVNFLNGVLPQFIPESLGYVFGLSAAFAIASLIIIFVQSMINKQSSLSFANASAYNLKYALASVGISIVLFGFCSMYRSIPLPIRLIISVVLLKSLMGIRCTSSMCSGHRFSNAIGMRQH